MLSVKIRIIIAMLLIIALLFVINAIVKKKLDVKYALPWFFMLSAVGVLDVFPFLLDVIAKLVGIKSSVNMMFFFGFCFSLMIIFRLTSIIYSVSMRLRKVSQELALLKREIEDKEKKL